VRLRGRCLTLRAVLAAVTVVVLMPAVPAAAQAPVPLGGGSGLVVDGETLCTLTAIGNDNQGRLPQRRIPGSPLECCLR